MLGFGIHAERKTGCKESRDVQNQQGQVNGEQEKTDYLEE